MEATTLIFVALGGLFLLVIAGAVVALVANGNRVNVDERLEQFAGTADWGIEAGDQDADAKKDEQVADRLDKAIGSRGFGFFDAAKQRLARADMKLRVTEYYVVVFLVGLLVGAVGFYLIGGMLGGLVGFAIGMQFPRVYTNRAAKKRVSTFEYQLGDTLNLWVNALRSGFSVMQGMEAIAAELPPPISKEFERIIQEIRLGIDMDDALQNSLRRVPSEDYDLVITAVNIQREVGGNLAEILDIISFTIRERVRIKGEIQTLTAQGRISGWVITLLPFGLGMVLFVINRPYIMHLIEYRQPWLIDNVLPCSWVVVFVAVTMVSAGGYAIQRIVDIEV